MNVYFPSMMALKFVIMFLELMIEKNMGTSKPKIFYCGLEESMEMIVNMVAPYVPL